MGLMDQGPPLNSTEKGTQLIDPKGQPFAPFPVKEGSIAGPTSEFEILRGDLVALLYEVTKTYPNVNYLFGTTSKQVASNGDNTVKGELSNGEVQDFDLLVAADGQWSKVRNQRFPPEDIEVIDKGVYVGYWTIPRLTSDNNW
jgi:2-polyprenyl-6-methoxyphenol hydroxylase-like FAD-dependent oxidoreductase